MIARAVCARIRRMEIRLHATLRDVVKARSVVIKSQRDQTVGAVLRALTDEHPALVPSIWEADGRLAGHVVVVLEGRDIRHLSGVDTPIGEAEKIDVFPPVGGGL